MAEAAAGNINFSISDAFSDLYPVQLVKHQLWQFYWVQLF
jgi:hypothetical protein